MHANTRLNVSTKFEYRIFEENIVECNNALFGGDPVPFVPKFCWCFMYDPPTEGFVQEEKAVIEIDESYLTMIAEKEAKYHHIRENSQPCADLDDPCYCPIGGTIYFGAQDEKEFMFNKKIGIDLWLNHTSGEWEFKTIHPCNIDTFGENPLETNVKHCYCFNEDKT